MHTSVIQRLIHNSIESSCELSAHKRCLTLVIMHSTQKQISRWKLLLCLSAVLALLAAANVGDEPATDPTSKDVSLEKRIAAFIKAGAEKKISNEDYDKENVIAFAESLIGTPHRMGGYSASGLDCSGLVKLAHEESAVELPRSSHDQARYGQIISQSEDLKRGDLVFFHSTYRKPHLVTHAGIYLGENKFIHASATRGVIISTLFDDGYYEKHYLFATRLID